MFYSNIKFFAIYLWKLRNIPVFLAIIYIILCKAIIIKLRILHRKKAEDIKRFHIELLKFGIWKISRSFAIFFLNIFVLCIYIKDSNLHSYFYHLIFCLLFKWKKNHVSFIYWKLHNIPVFLALIYIIFCIAIIIKFRILYREKIAEAIKGFLTKLLKFGIQNLFHLSHNFCFSFLEYIRVMHIYQG